MKYASCVIVGNDYLFNYAATFRADNIHIIPTVIDLERYSLQTSSESIVKTDRICFGWIGQHSTAYNLQFLQGIFKTFLSEISLIFAQFVIFILFNLYNIIAITAKKIIIVNVPSGSIYNRVANIETIKPNSTKMDKKALRKLPACDTSTVKFFIIKDVLLSVKYL